MGQTLDHLIELIDSFVSFDVEIRTMCPDSAHVIALLEVAEQKLLGWVSDPSRERLMEFAEAELAVFGAARRVVDREWKEN
jgi:hypothetical protein